MVSLSSWRAWIEICDSLRRAHVWKSLSSWRAWIEMKTGRMPPTPATCRSPHGERGLKYDSHGAAQDHRRSLSSWRAWIEIRRSARSSTASPSFSSWRAWIEIAGSSAFAPYKGSLSSWRAWIEIGVCIVPAAAWMLLSLFMSSVPRTCGIPHVRDC